jgi:acetyltransferase-like isoleucine patch superfamily enzyme
VSDGVALGVGCIIEAYVVLGGWSSPEAEGESLVIGDGARIRSHSVIYAGSTIGDGLQTGHGVLIREGNTIGDRVSVGSHAVVEHHVVIGHGVRLHSNVFVPEFSVIDDDAWIGPNVVFTNARYPRSAGVKESLVGPHIETRAKVGANATLLPGVRVGQDALVGAGAVVIADVRSGDVVVGNPARTVGRIDDLPAYAGLLGSRRGET